MNTNTAASPYCLDHVSNGDLHQSTRRLVGRSNQVLADLLAHLAEVEARGIHRERACTSLYTYCIYELRMSEDAAFRRARAAKIARQFPILFEQIAAGEIHLSGVLMLGAVLTEANHREVLALAKHRTKRELMRLVRLVSPLVDARCVVEPLGPATSQPLIDRYGDIRELEPGDRPRDWTEGDSADPFAELATGDADASSGANAISSAVTTSNADTKNRASAVDAAPTPLVVPQRYMIQFTAPQEYVDLLEKAKRLSAYETRSLVEIHLRAMRAFVSELEKRRCGATSQGRTTSADASPPETDPHRLGQTSTELFGRLEESADAPGQRGESSERPRPAVTNRVPRQRGESGKPLERGDTAEALAPQQRNDGDRSADLPRRRGRHVPRAVRRVVWERDEGRCTYVDDRGVRCHETACLELDHVLPQARGGPATTTNLRLRCRAHNQLAAENDFGREFMDRKKGHATAPRELAASASVAESA